jgi:hypothetical protein
VNYLVIATTPRYQGLLGPVPEKTTLHEVPASSRKQAADSIPTTVRTKIRVVELETVSVFERTTQLEETAHSTTGR